MRLDEVACVVRVDELLGLSTVCITDSQAGLYEASRREEEQIDLPPARKRNRDRERERESVKHRTQVSQKNGTGSELS